MAIERQACSAKIHRMLDSNAAQESCRVYLHRGVQVLSRVLQKFGFKYEDGDSGVSSGGPFATGFLIHPQLRIGLIVRYKECLGSVNYETARDMASHDDIFRELGMGEPELTYSEQEFHSTSRTGGNEFEAMARDLEHKVMPAFIKNRRAFHAAIRSSYTRRLEEIGILRPPRSIIARWLQQIGFKAPN